MDSAMYVELANKVAVLEERIKGLDGKYLSSSDYHKDKSISDAKLIGVSMNAPTNEDWDDLDKKIIVLEAKVFELEAKIGTKISITEFSPIKALVFGAVGILLVGALGGLGRVIFK